MYINIFNLAQELNQKQIDNIKNICENEFFLNRNLFHIFTYDDLDNHDVIYEEQVDKILNKKNKNLFDFIFRDNEINILAQLTQW